MPKASWSGSLCFHIIGHLERKLGQELKAATWRQKLAQTPGKNAAYCPVPHGFFSLFSYTTWDHLPRHGTVYSEQGSPTSIIKQNNKNQADLPVGQSIRKIFHIEITSSQILQVCVRLTKINHYIVYFCFFFFLFTPSNFPFSLPSIKLPYCQYHYLYLPPLKTLLSHYLVAWFCFLFYLFNRFNEIYILLLCKSLSIPGKC